MDAPQADRDRMKILLVEAIATLCRNGLQFKDELSVEGLIGITVDKSDVFLVSVRETFSLTPPAAEKETETPQNVNHVNVNSPISRRGPKRPSGMHDGAPSEKHKRKGAPKQILAEDVDLLNNSPADVPDASLDGNEDSIGGSDTVSERLGTHQQDSDYVDHSDHRKRKKTEDDDVAEEDEDVVYIDPDMNIKQERVKGEADQNSCMFDSSPSVFTDSPQTVTRPPPPLHPRPNPADPRNSHPSGLDSDQLTLAYTTSIKQEPEMIRIPGTANKFANRSPVPVNMVSNVPPGNQSLEELDDMQAYPVDWGNQSAQEFIPMPGDDSTDQSASTSNQASGSGGASQQMLKDPYHSIEVIRVKSSDGSAAFQCPYCQQEYNLQQSAKRHVLSKHLKFKYTCPYCPYTYTQRSALRAHVIQKHTTL